MLHQSPSSARPLQRTSVLQGQIRVSTDASAELSTVLGSCVAACLFDPQAQIGGMNHFLLAEPPVSHDPGEVDVHYGTYLMELLINEMLSKGALKQRIKAHLYGGANLRAGMASISTGNVMFARSFLDRERIPLLRHDLGGKCARRVDFRPATGLVRCRRVENTLVPDAKPATQTDRTSGNVEFF